MPLSYLPYRFFRSVPLPQQHCFLKNKADFMRLLRQGKSIYMTPWRLYFYPNNRRAARFGVVVAKRHAKSAVLRNRLRRQLREWFRQELSVAPLAADFLVRSVAVISPAKKRRVREDCRRLFDAVTRQ